MLSSILIACEKPSGCHENWRRTTEKTASLEPFNHLVFPSYLTVNWEYGMEYKVKLIGNEKLLNELNWNKTSDTLIFDYIPKCEWLRNHRDRIFVTITSPSISSVILQGSTKFSTSDTIRSEFKFGAFNNYENHILLINNNRTYIQLHAASPTVTASGFTQEALYYAVGSSRLKCKSLIANWVYMDNFSSSPIQIYSSDTIEILQNGSGDISIWGNPSTLNILNESGSGNWVFK
jgi:hypothetical protein